MTPIILASVAQNFTQSLLILVEGMGGIFLFMGLFYALILVLEKLFQGKKEA